METLTLVNNFSSTAFIPAGEKHWLASLGDLTQAHTVNFHLTFDTAGGAAASLSSQHNAAPFFTITTRTFCYWEFICKGKIKKKSFSAKML